jgi:peptidyl-prolyl cis-trans isomerase-like protein 2
MLLSWGEGDSFITFTPCHHLDNKHTVFGKVVDGMEVLSKMEKIPTNEKDSPQVSIVMDNLTYSTIFDHDHDDLKNDIKILQITIDLDPFEDYKKHEEKKIQKQQEELCKRRVDIKDERPWLDFSSHTGSAGEVGKYLKK